MSKALMNLKGQLSRLKEELSSRELSNKADLSELKPESRFSNGNDELILELLGNKYINQILCMTSMKDSSALELSLELDIPLATVYRKLKLLEENNIIEVSKTIINLSGNEEKYYRCLISEATVNFYNGNISVNLKKLEPTKKILRLWERFAKSECSENDKVIAD